MIRDAKEGIKKSSSHHHEVSCQLNISYALIPEIRMSITLLAKLIKNKRLLILRNETTKR